MPPVDYEVVLEQQFEEYRYIRSKAWALIRIFIASSAVLAAFSTSEVLDLVLDALRRLESSEGLTSGTPDDLIFTIAEPTALLIATYAALFFLKSLFSLRELLQVPRLRPATSTKQHPTQADNLDIKEIIAENGVRIEEMNELLRTSLSESGRSALYLISSVLIIFTVDYGYFAPVYILAIAAGLSGIYNIANFVKFLADFFRGNSVDIGLNRLMKEDISISYFKPLLGLIVVVVDWIVNLLMLAVLITIGFIIWPGVL